MPQSIFNTLRREKWVFAFAALTIFLLISAGLHFSIAVLAGCMVLVPVLFRGNESSVRPDWQTPPGFADNRTMAYDPLAIAGVAVAAIDAPVFFLDGDGIVLYENPAANRVFGEIPVGQHISARLRSPALLDMIRDTVLTGKPNQIVHSERLPSEDVYRVRLERASAIAGTPIFYVLFFRDISEAHRIERMRSDFVANASHELRTPLASLRGFIETMQGPARKDEAAREKFLGIMLDQVTRMSRLVDDLLSLSRLELKSRIAPEDQVDLKPLVAAVAATLAPLAEELGVSISLDLPAHPVVVTGNQDELTEVFENLIENACKYGQSGECVEVRMTGGDGVPVEVSVTDHGPGIPEEHVPRLTERFYRVNVEHSRHKKGTGLGLAIVKHILTRHRANLLIRSQLGKGSTFTVRF